MSLLTQLTDEECYLFAILDDPSGIDQAEFTWVDEEQTDGIFRLYDYQWSWFACDDIQQADCCSRDVGKTVGIVMRSYAFPFAFPGQEMCITAPELNHLRPICDAIEARITSSRLASEMLPRDRGRGMARQPHFQVRFANGARIITRLPNKDGKGIKGVHSVRLEVDEAQDYPLAGWVEIVETFKRRSANALWWIHGVPRGVRDKFFEFTQKDSEFTVHRIMAMHRPTWSARERESKIKTYGGSRQNPDYRRNIYGDHGDATNPVFVLNRLMSNVDIDEGSDYNTNVYAVVRIIEERVTEDTPVVSFLDTGVPGLHLATHPAAPHGYSAYWGGMDVGLTDHPSEVLIFGQRAKDRDGMHDLLLRIHMQRIDTEDQLTVIDWLFDFYGSRLLGFGIDSGGLGFPIYQQLKRRKYAARVHGWKANEKVVVGFEDGEPSRGSTWEELAIYRPFLEHTTDVLRNDFVDARRLLLPYDPELLTEWQGQSYVVIKSRQGPYGRTRQFSDGSFHTLDAGRLFAAVKTLPPLEARLDKKPEHDAILDAFVGGDIEVAKGAPTDGDDDPTLYIDYADYGVF